MRFTPEQEEAILQESGLPSIIPPEVMAEIKRQYSDPARYYHDWGHALSVLSWVNHVCSHLPSIAPEDYTLPNPYVLRDMKVAALCHDVVYLPEKGSPYNEEQSVFFMREHLPQFPHAEDFVMATAKHGKSKRDETLPLEIQLFLDCDLAYAFADPRWEVFTYFNRLVELEFMKVFEPELVFAGRRKFLQGMLDSDGIFLSDYFRKRFEGSIRANMARLLAQSPSPVESEEVH